MLRTVLAALLATALVGAGLSAVDAVREERTATLAGGELSRLAERATELVRAEEATPGGAARRTVSLSLPDRGLATAALAYVSVGGVPNCGTPRDTATTDVVAYRLRDGSPRVAHVPVDFRVVSDGQVRGDEDPLVLRDDARLSLSLVRREGAPVVRVARAHGTTTDGSGTSPGGSGD